MAITLKHRDGVGVNSRWTIYRDGTYVALISHPSRRGWEINSARYSHCYATVPTLETAKERAPTIVYHSAEELYAIRCAQAEAARRRAAQEAEGPALAKIFTDWLNPDSAVTAATVRSQVQAIFANIEKFALDKTRYHYSENPWQHYERNRGAYMAYPWPLEEKPAKALTA